MNRKNKNMNNELEKIIQEENLDRENTLKFVEKSIARGEVWFHSYFISCLPPISRFRPDNAYGIAKASAIAKLENYFRSRGVALAIPCGKKGMQ